MTIASIVKMGNAKLATPSIPVENFADPALAQLLIDMKETMLAENGVGIAAPQIGTNFRVIMFGMEYNPRYPQEEAIPFTILINPEIKILTDEMVDGWEGCLSVPGLRGLVPRYTKIQYSGYAPDEGPISRIVEGFHARVFQHEFDHLNGILYPQRIKDLKYFGFEDSLG